MTRTVYFKMKDVDSNCRLDEFPHYCGLCQKNIEPIFISLVYVNRKMGFDNEMEAVFQCTNLKCNSLMICYYHRTEGTEPFELKRTTPHRHVEKEFNEDIKKVSSNFAEIYNQSYEAEQDDLNHISGLGYRKALEFLIKDYLVFLHSDKGKESKERYFRMPLSQCIDQLENERIKQMSKRAAWLGNDEAHYLRKWEDKDVNDLKILIEVVVHYISMDIAAKRYLDEMN
ncbi:DUF4145 domain-containing protein [Ornithinibacillus sp. L9]|uniref:DUF4145 domain-containing protein n=1 Tax=Ornithinibacillus caprae TaxID=2678566 RepID=A0A6N8FHU2_9BACI|nr:DUF4145 domain-containing protein [Ornithinibacillus caprae]MUK89160.1 DUF4145 domain-containing protein [Ornithinibacillus caprae]